MPVRDSWGIGVVSMGEFGWEDWRFEIFSSKESSFFSTEGRQDSFSLMEAISFSMCSGVEKVVV